MIGWLLVAWLGVAPALGAWNYRRLKRALATRGARARRRFYRRTLLVQWSWTAAIVAWAWPPTPARLWLVGADAGWSGWLRALALGSVLALMGVLFAPLFSVGGRRVMTAALDQIRDLLPDGAEERRWYAAIALSAGICEELLYRGFFCAWLASQVPSMGFTAILAITTGAFGIAHAYQGVRGVIGTSVLGAAFALAFGSAGSLVLPMLLHALVDLRILLVRYARPTSA